MSSGEVSDQTGSVHGNVATFRAGERNIFSEEGRDLVFEVDSEVVRLVLGRQEGQADLTLVGGRLEGQQTGPGPG